MILHGHIPDALMHGFFDLVRSCTMTRGFHWNESGFQEVARKRLEEDLAQQLAQVNGPTEWNKKIAQLFQDPNLCLVTIMMSTSSQGCYLLHVVWFMHWYSDTCLVYIMISDFLNTFWYIWGNGKIRVEKYWASSVKRYPPWRAVIMGFRCGSIYIS